MSLPRFIDASAGTGKTYRLAWCYLAALARYGGRGEGGEADYERVAACTFTVAAAAEFRHRVREFLAFGRAEFNQRAEEVGVDASGLDLEKLAARLPTLGIRTLDSLFLHLLCQAVPGTTARLPTPMEADQASRDAYAAWLADDAGRVGRFGVAQGGGLYKALVRFAEGAEGYPEEDVRGALAAPGEEEGESWAALLAEEAAQSARAALSLLPAAWGPTPRSKERMGPLRDALAGFVADPMAGGPLAKLLSSMAGEVAAGGDLPLAALVPLRQATEIVRAVAGLRVAAEETMAKDLLAYSRHHREALDNRGLLGSGGVAVRLLAALEAGRPLGEPAIAWLLVDEYQDTSPLQARVLNQLLVCLGPEAGMTVVGDEKQAIYRFRGASTGPFRAARGKVAEVVRLDTSRRTGPALLAACNWLLAPFLPSLGEHPPTAHPSAPESGRVEAVPLTVWVCREPWRKKSGRGLLTGGRKETKVALAERALDAVVWLRENRPGESVLVLGRSWSLLSELAGQLAVRGVPVRLAGDPNLLSDPDVQALASALRVLAWPEDPVHSLAVLRGPAFAFTVAELEAGGDEVVAARGALAAWAMMAATTRTAVGVLAEMLAATGWLEGLGGDPRAHERRLRVLEALEWLRVAEERDAPSAAALADLVEQGAREGLRVHAPSPAAHGSVTLRTVHGAKGLEEDHVVLVDPEGNRPLGMGARLLPARQDPMEPWRPAPAHFEPAPDGRLGGLWLPLPSPGVPVWMSPGFMGVWKEGRKEEARERINLIYVGLTRARKTAHLVVPGYLQRGDRAQGSLMEPLYAAMDPGGDWPERMADAGGLDEVVRVEIPADHLLPQQLSPAQAAAQFVPPGRRRAAPVAGGLPAAPPPPAPASLALPGGEEEAAAPLETGPAAARGDWVHRVLQALGIPEGEPDDEWVEGAGRIPHGGRQPTAADVEDLRARLASLAALPEWRESRARWTDGPWPEYALPGPQGHTVCDLLARTAEGLLVVDWKTGRRDGETEQKYEEQVRGYLEGVAQAVAGTTLAGARVEGLVVWLDEEPPFLQRVAPA